jgi:hypothetical protein
LALQGRIHIRFYRSLDSLSYASPAVKFPDTVGEPTHIVSPWRG